MEVKFGHIGRTTEAEPRPLLYKPRRALQGWYDSDCSAQVRTAVPDAASILTFEGLKCFFFLLAQVCL
jgi:hypothetical protein